MIFANLGVMLGVYFGTRVYRGLQRRFQRPAGAAPLPAPEVGTLTLEAPATHQHHFQVSSAALLTSSIGYVLYPPLSLVNLGLITYTSLPILEQAQHSLGQEKQLKNDSLSLIVTSLCVLTNNYFAAVVQNWVYHLGSHMVDKSKQNTELHLTQAFRQQPREIWVLKQGIEMQMPFSDLVAGDTVVVKTGELIPVDGYIQQGHALIDQQVMTGEASPVERRTGEAVLAETLVIGGSILVRVNQGGAESQAQQLHKLLEQTTDFKTELQLKGEAWSDAMAKPLLVVSAGTGLLFGLSPATALLFSAPTNSIRALLSLQTNTHLQWAADQGILIKDGRVLEELPWIDTLLFDKTGTLTQLQPEVGKILACGSLSETQVLRLAAAAEQHLQHPIANAIGNHAKGLGLELPEADDSFYDIGFGVRVKIYGKQVHVGSQRFIEEITGKYNFPSEVERLLHNASGHTFIFLAVERTLQGVIELYPKVRPEAARAIEQLRERGIRSIAVVSGDLLAPTERLAHSLGIDKVFAEVKPQDKAALISSLQQQGHRVCFVGDGINDTLAMKQANVSVCLSDATEISRSTAQIVLLNNQLTDLRDAFDMAAHLQLNLSGNLLYWLSFGFANALLVPFGISPLQSSLLYAGAFGWGFHKAKQPGWLAKPERHPAPPEDNSDAIEGEPIYPGNGSHPTRILLLEPYTVSV